MTVPVGGGGRHTRESAVINNNFYTHRTHLLFTITLAVPAGEGPGRGGAGGAEAAVSCFPCRGAQPPSTGLKEPGARRSRRGGFLSAAVGLLVVDCWAILIVGLWIVELLVRNTRGGFLPPPARAAFPLPSRGRRKPRRPPRACGAPLAVRFVGPGQAVKEGGGVGGGGPRCPTMAAAA